MLTLKRDDVDQLQRIHAMIGDLLGRLNSTSSPLPTVQRCLQCGSVEELRSRGLCGRCYNRTMQQIRRGSLTEEEAVAANLIAAVALPGGRRPNERTALDDYLARKAGKDPVVEAALADVIHVASGGQSRFGTQEASSQAVPQQKASEKAPAKQQKAKAKTEK